MESENLTTAIETGRFYDIIANKNESVMPNCLCVKTFGMVPYFRPKQGRGLIDAIGEFLLFEDNSLFHYTIPYVPNAVTMKGKERPEIHVSAVRERILEPVLYSPTDLVGPKLYGSFIEFWMRTEYGLRERVNQIMKNNVSPEDLPKYGKPYMNILNRLADYIKIYEESIEDFEREIEAFPVK